MRRDAGAHAIGQGRWFPRAGKRRTALRPVMADRLTPAGEPLLGGQGGQLRRGTRASPELPEQPLPTT